MLNFVLASDHGGVALKAAVKKYLEKNSINVDDLGTQDPTALDFFPENADELVEKILTKKADLGVLICGSGIGISMRANRYMGIRAALVSSEFTAESAKAHNNANVICFGGRVTSEEEVCKYMDIFLETQYEGGRHEERLAKLDAPLVVIEEKGKNK